MHSVNWREEYEKKITTPEEAMKVVEKGSSVTFAYGSEPLALGTALVNRGLEVGEVNVFVPAPGRDFVWYDPGWEETFRVNVGCVLPICREMIAERRGDYLVSSLHWSVQTGLRKSDVILIQVSPPDDHGFCSFGASLWNQKVALRDSKVVLAEVNKNLIRTYGDNFVHVSEIDYFVEHTPTGKVAGSTDMLGRKTTGPGAREKKITEYVSSLIRDGDVVELGAGGAAEHLFTLGAFEGKNDIGVHSENLPPGIVSLVRRGIVNNETKNIHRGKVVSTACGGSSKEDMDFINMNPLFELYSSYYVLDPGTIASNDNVLAINSALTVDLTGQIAAESLGSTMISTTGGQLAFAIGASMSKGGRSIVTLHSTVKDDTVSCIVPALSSGTVVTVPRVLADIVVTEYGIAYLRGKTQRERAQELISVAHPDFRAQLNKEARKLF